MTKEPLTDSQVQAQILKQLKRTNRFLGIFAGLVLTALVGVIIALVMVVSLVRTTIQTVKDLPSETADNATEQICDSPLGSLIGDSEFCSE